MTQCLLRSAPAFDKDVLSPLHSSITINWILGQALQDYPGVQVGATVHVSDDIVILSSRYSKTQGLPDSVNGHAAAEGMPINASKPKVMSALVPDEQRQAVLGSMFVTNGQGSEEIRSRITLARSAFSRLQSCLWSRREISLRTKGRVYQAVVRSILLYGCETWPVRVADEGCWKSLTMTASAAFYFGIVTFLQH